VKDSHALERTFTHSLRFMLLSLHRLFFRTPQSDSSNLSYDKPFPEPFFELDLRIPVRVKDSHALDTTFHRQFIFMVSQPTMEFLLSSTSIETHSDVSIAQYLNFGSIKEVNGPSYSSFTVFYTHLVVLDSFTCKEVEELALFLFRNIRK
jgi:hypothetical protein